jgi:tetratricopeptide (TPR) repeat protein
VHQLTGDEAMGWKVAKARYLLTSDNKQRDSAEAVGILTTLVAQSPDTTEYRVLLAAGLMNLGNTRGAIEHLKPVVEKDPGAIDTIIDLIKLLQQQGLFDDARAYLDRATKSPGLTPESRKTLAVMLAQQGEIQRAVDVLQPVANDLDSDGQLILAELYRKRGDAGDAEAIYTSLLKNPSPSADAIASAADFFASTDRLDQAKQTLARLKDDRFTAAQQATLMARFNELYVNKDAAREQFIAATNASPKDVDAWRELAEFYIRDNRFDDAIATADAGLKNIPNNDALTTIKAQAMALRSTKNGQNDLRPLIEALSKDPKNAAQVEMLKTIQVARDTKQTPAQIVAKLKTIADKYPNYYPLQVQLVNAYVAMNQLNDAATIAERLMNARPNDPAAAKLATGVYRSAQRWREMRLAADKWRQRTLDRPVDADVALAEASLALGDTKDASDRLAPYTELAIAQPLQRPTLTAAVAKLMVATGKVTEAKFLLQPLLSQGVSWRRLWLSLAAGTITPAETASEWIRIGAAAVPDDAPDETVTVAQAWQQMGTRLKNADAINSARDLLKETTADEKAPLAAILLLASIDADAGDLSSAEQLYRRALKLQADAPEVMNNLAYTILQTGGDLNEAKDLAKRAIALMPNLAALHDTLARICEKQSDRDSARKEFEEALRLDPTNLDARIGLSRTLSLAGQKDKAAIELQRIDSQLKGTPPNSESTRKELQSLRERLSSSSTTD